MSKALFAHHLYYLTLNTPQKWHIQNHRVISNSASLMIYDMEHTEGLADLFERE